MVHTDTVAGLITAALAIPAVAWLLTSAHLDDLHEEAPADTDAY